MGEGLPSGSQRHHGHALHGLRRRVRHRDQASNQGAHLADQGVHDQGQDHSLLREDEDVRDQAHRRRPLAEPAYRPQGYQWQAVLGHVSQNHQQPAKCHLQPCRALLRPDGQPVQEGNEDGLEERRRDELLDEEGVSEVLGGHHGQASFLLCF